MRRFPAIDVYAAPMQRERAERIALTEAAFRIANERMAAWEEVPPDAEELFFCECASFECRQKVPLTQRCTRPCARGRQWFLDRPGP